jgi:hypothetical protein
VPFLRVGRWILEFDGPDGIIRTGEGSRQVGVGVYERKIGVAMAVVEATYLLGIAIPSRIKEGMTVTVIG